MISVLIFCHKKKEADILHKLCGYCTGMMGAEMQICDIYGASLRKQTERTAEHGHSWDILIFEISSEEDLSELKRLRNIFPEAELLIIASPRISPAISGTFFASNNAADAASKQTESLRSHTPGADVPLQTEREGNVYPQIVCPHR